jgi:GNAT superfamily N-acetyltransferase
MIVPLTRDRIHDVVWLALDMNRESPVYAQQKVDIQYTNAYLLNAWDHGVLFGFVDDAMNGVILGSVAAPWSTPTKQAAEWLLYVRPKYRGTGMAVKLVTAFTEEARQRGAQKLYVGSSTGINDEGVRKLYERMGFLSVGSSLVKEL